MIDMDDPLPSAALTPLHGANPLQPHPHATSRRGFLRGVGAGAAALGTLALSGCSSAEDPAPPVTFVHGVASGDPLSDRIVLWTRITTATTGRVPVVWEVAPDATFAVITARGAVETHAAIDWTVKVDATGLAAGRQYWFRFTVAESVSPVGRTRTLPAAGAARVRFAVFSCSNYPAGFFNAYAEAARRTDLDAAIHLGDYLYEYARNGYASAGAQGLGRLSEPATELLTLADYRRRHAQYRTDLDLQALHASVPMIAVWDDHEIANDAWRDGAENHQPDEGDYPLRRSAALQAYHEWMPTRVQRADAIWRSFDFGGLVALHMLDTRIVGRDQPLDYTRFFRPAGFDAAGFTAAVGNPQRQLLGAEQTAWLQQRLGASSATWQILGQQVLMGRMNIPAPILSNALFPGTGVTVGQYAAIAQKAQVAPTTLTAQEQAILSQPSIPYNLDAWDGYAAARETVLATAAALDRNLVVLAGDTHNAWANDLLDANGRRVGVEFATPSVSSPGFETVFPDESPAVLAGALVQLIGPLQYADTARRGYMVVTATATECTCDWIYVSTVTSRDFTSAIGRTLRVRTGAAGRRIEL